MTSLLLDHPGAAPAQPPDDGVAWHYGDPLREQRALTEGVGWVDRSNRGVLRVTGEDRLSWLHSLTTQDLDTLGPGRGTEALVLSPQGHVEHHLVIAETGTTFIDIEPHTVADLMTFLESMRFLLRVEPIDVSDATTLLSLVGPGTTALLDGAGLGVGPEAYDVAAHGDVVVRRMPWPSVDAADLIVPTGQVHDAIATLERLGATPAGLWAFEALRVAAHRPRLHVDTDHRTLPHEVGWIETAVNLTKGCYRGQETVARVHNLGRPPRRLVFLHLDGSDESLPQRGAVVEADGAPVGFVGSAVRHFELGPIGLALIRRGTPQDASLTAGGVPATAEVIVDPEAGLHIRPVLG
ncbi:MAG: YgfZ/GcvT domain-containing protein [Actinomycetes bacterium]